MISDRPDKILIVDDNLAHLHVLLDTLNDMGEVFLAKDGTSGLEIAAREHVDLVIVDVEMPDISGLEFCRTIKADPLTQDVSIIVITGHQGHEIELAALNAGAVDFISKPLIPEIVRARTHNHLTIQRQSRMLKDLSLKDGLTGIANRRSFDDTAQMEWARACRSGEPLSLLLVDIDYFKKYNDYYGHQAGDACLKSVAQILRTAARRSSDFVARFGGEEFVLLMPGTDQAGLVHKGSILVKDVRDADIPHHFGIDNRVSISVGGVCSVLSIGDEKNISKFIDAADQALYTAKAAGRNRFINADIDLT